MKTRIRTLLLQILNSHWLNATPGRYMFVNGLDAISYEELQNEEKQQPGITVKEVIRVIDKFRSCPMRGSALTVIEGDEVREATVWDVHDLKQSFEKASFEDK